MNKSDNSNKPAPISSGSELRSIDDGDIMIVSDGELPTEPGEILPEKPNSMPTQRSKASVPGDPRKVTNIDDDTFYDESLGGGYASIKEKKSGQNRLVWMVLIVMSVICLAVGVCSSVLTGYFMRRGGTPPSIDTTNKYQDISAVVALRKQCIVEVSSGSLRGSGVITKMENGKIYILTNYHVISSGAPSVRFAGSDDFWVATDIGYDSYYDVAVLTVASTVAPYEVYNLDGSEFFSRNTDCAEGDLVVAIGNAMGYGIASYDGIISRKYELLEYSSGSTPKVVPVMRTTAAINAGMSGGALFDTDGRFVGLGTYRIASSSTDPDAGHGSDVEDTGLVVPSSVVYPIYKQILEYGASGRDINASQMMRPSKPDTSAIGALTFFFNEFGGFTAEYRNGKLTVVSLDFGTPAPGIEIGDVIKSIGSGTAVAVTDNICNTCGELLCYKYGSYTGSKLRLTLDRSGTEVVVTVDKYYKLVE